MAGDVRLAINQGEVADAIVGGVAVAVVDVRASRDRAMMQRPHQPIGQADQAATIDINLHLAATVWQAPIGARDWHINQARALIAADLAAMAPDAALGIH